MWKLLVVQYQYVCLDLVSPFTSLYSVGLHQALSRWSAYQNNMILKG